ncbi:MULTISPECIES: GAF and ANTAR domain-containing protein [Streptomycetaceae]|uniref:ANTAR domain-containing protein n=1 Tax=Streptantibioticus cattleyicolor (strain ATCC 35852 / DSM 46488 / JCM 4925 / NBRC 14057 / NRRL 8057) TaxID=1003195 RepID=G8WWD5_STREN|nr:GAF and ANTAR domain-containing protein [Streptantibioticus cattleyicolor]AEW94342.1 hypothetical protein SCATT_19710 [Streptantibioticus cattleyicolor NRRL 8057 = DSM 46488]MYS58993.1 ANTAR domain-containing protein [Streptomyces sp. SID5468]
MTAYGPGLDFSALHRTLAGTAGLDEFLQELTVRAVKAMPYVDGCSIMLRRDGRPATVASSDDVSRLLDERQYEALGGPCLSSVEHDREQIVADARDERRWNGYADFLLERGVRSVLAVPMGLDGDGVGALNFYARLPHTFDADAVTAARRLAAQAAGAVHVALRIDRHLEETEDLRTALTSRSVIDQALGIVMARRRCPAHEALELLRRASQHRNLKLRELCAGIVEEVSGAPPSTGGFQPRR